MGAFILAGLVAIATIVFAVLQVFAAGMSDVPNADSGAGWTLGIGLIAAVVVAVSHWFPHIGW